MRILRNDFSRFFALGFAGGAALVFTLMTGDQPADLSNSLVPPAVAAPAQP